MGRTAKDLEAYLLAMGRRYQTAPDGTLVLASTGEGRPPIGVRVGEPVVFSAEMGAVPEGDAARQASLYRALLELNSSDLLYCAYGVRGDQIVLSSAHELANLDMNEIEAILSDFDLAIASFMKAAAGVSASSSTGGSAQALARSNQGKAVRNHGYVRPPRAAHQSQSE